MSHTNAKPEATYIRLSVCAGAKPRVSIGVPKAVFESTIGTPPGLKAVVRVDHHTGRLRIEYGYAGNYMPEGARTVFGGENSGYYWTQFYPADAPWPCVAEKRGAVKIPARVEGRDVVSQIPMPAEFFTPGDAPADASAGCAPIEDGESEPATETDPREALARSLADLNARIAAAKAAGRELRIKVVDDRVAIRLVEEVDL